MAEWVRARWKRLLVHSLILSGFMLFCVFVSGSLFDRFEAIEGESGVKNISVPAETGNVVCRIDVLEGGIHIIEIRGWAFIDGQSSEDGEVSVVLVSERNCYMFDTLTQRRPDVTLVYISLNLNLDRSGFVCSIPSRKISDGQYVIGVQVRKGDVEAFVYTDRVMVKSGGSVESWIVS